MKKTISFTFGSGAGPVEFNEENFNTEEIEKILRDLQEFLQFLRSMKFM